MHRFSVTLLVLCMLVAGCGGKPTATPAPTATQPVAEAATAVAEEATAPSVAEVTLPADTPAPATPAVAATDTPAATATTAPTSAPTATPKPPTPVPTATATHAPVPVPPGTDTPTISPSPTPTTAPPTPTRKPRPSATPTPTRTPTLFPAPKLLLPLPGAPLVEWAQFRWQWEGPALPEGYAFDLRIWSEREEKAGAVPRGAVELTRKTEAEVTLQFVPAMEFGEGNYYWTVVVVLATKPPKVVGQWGEKRWFVYREPTPTPTETPEPPATPNP